MSEAFNRLTHAVAEVCRGLPTNQVVSALLVVMVQAIRAIPEFEYRDALVLYVIRHLARLSYPVDPVDDDDVGPAQGEA